MADKKLIFMAVNMLITVFSLAIIIATMFIENQRIKTTAIFVAITILIVQKIVEIKVIKEKESPILYKVNPGECFYINTKDKTLRMEVSTPLYEKVEIFRNLEDAPEVEHIALKPDDYALMLYYYSTKDKDNSSLEHIKNRQQKLNHLISDNALIYQIFDNEIYGVETLSKQKYIGLV